mmetsp:Transcript_18558/g.34564  ORF Transcript_18558/g.34564 Transcript_18558/m.34564 type:complete len:291 (-) Transcript_18558:488-1360(-)
MIGYTQNENAISFVKSGTAGTVRDQRKVLTRPSELTLTRSSLLHVLVMMMMMMMTMPCPPLPSPAVLVAAWQPRFGFHFHDHCGISGYCFRWTILYQSGKSSSNQDDETKPSAMVTSSTNTKVLEDPTNVDDLLSLQDQAAKLRAEAISLQKALEQSKLEKIQKETEKVDRWIEELLIEAKVNENTELLKTVDQVFERLTEDRYSAEQVNKIFKRLCEIRQQESRSNCSPLMSLLVDAAGKLDCTEREENPNKRWNHKVERGLQKKLFARDWNIELDDEENDVGNPWKLR